MISSTIAADMTVVPSLLFNKPSCESIMALTGTEVTDRSNAMKSAGSNSIPK